MREIITAPEDLPVALVLDARNLSCPMPLLRAKKEIARIQSGEILQILGTDPGSRDDLASWCEHSRNEYLGERKESGCLNFYIKKR